MYIKIFFEGENNKSMEKILKLPIKQSNWKEKTIERLDSLLSYKDLKRVMDDETLKLIESNWKEFTHEDIPKIDLLDQLLCIYSKDILFSPKIGQSLRKTLARRLGFKLSKRFVSGKASAIDFVKRCGLPIELSGSINRKKDSFIMLHGRYKLPPLKEYQAEIKKELIAFFKEGKKDRKPCIMSLPTGAGKTRVTVESIHGWVGDLQEESKDPKLCNLIVWIAQTNELCEQAFIQFKEMWSAKPNKKKIKLVRLWGGLCKKEDKKIIGGSIESTEHPVVLITTNKTLESLLNDRDDSKQENSSLREQILEHIDLLVIDEAHHTAASTYQTCIQEIQNYNSHSSECRILGITATPFRNTLSPVRDLEEIFSGGLICGQYSSTDFKKKLQEDKILSVDKNFGIHTNFTININESDDYDKEIREQIDSSRFRHKRRKNIAQEIVNLFNSEKKTNPSMLYFGVSVQDAKLMSFLLNVRQIKSAVITGETNSYVRDGLIQEFKDKKIQVLCNCRVLTTGFDAPQVSHIVMGWRTSSPVLLQQIIGRGLRGREFGGTDVCKIYQAVDSFKGKIPPSGIDEYLRMWTPADTYHQEPA